MPFSVEVIRCDFGFTELDHLLSVLQTGKMSTVGRNFEIFSFLNSDLR
jgi:hypothetical protein